MSDNTVKRITWVSDKTGFTVYGAMVEILFLLGFFLFWVFKGGEVVCSFLKFIYMPFY